MSERSRWARYWRALGLGREVNDELEFHVEMLTRDLVAQGHNPEAARREAARRFGDRARLQRQLEQVERRRGHRLRLTTWLEETRRDLVLGARGLLKRPLFTVAAVGSLGLGIAAATVVLTIVDQWLLRPLAVERPSELVVIGARNRAIGNVVIPTVSLPTLADVALERDLFHEVAGWRLQSASVRRPAATQSDYRMLLATTGNYFSMLGVRPALGRLYGDTEARERVPVVVLNHRYWDGALGGDRGVIGQPLVLNGTEFTIIGVLPPAFEGTEPLVDPIGFVTVGAAGLLDRVYAGNETDRRAAFYQGLARRQLGADLAAIRARLDALVGRLGREWPDWFDGYSLVAFPERQARPTISTAEQLPVVGALLGALAALVLITAAINVANLILARQGGRREELVVKLALGASRWRLVRQMLAESMLLGGLAYALAWLLSSVALRAIGQVRIAAGLDIRIAFEAGGRVAAMSLVAALGAGLLAGFGPALVATKEGLQATLRRRGRTLGGGLRSGLIVAQVAGAVVVLVCAGLLAASGRRAAMLDIGMRPGNALVTSLEATQAGLDAAHAMSTFQRIRDGAERIPGVTRVSLARGVPLAGQGIDTREVFLDQENAATNRRGSISVLSVDGDERLFGVLGIKVTAGRGFSVEDDAAAPQVAIVNQAAAELLWPGADPLGRTFRRTIDGVPITVVGVVPTGRYILMYEEPRPAIFLPLAQTPDRTVSLLVESRLDPRTLERELRSVIGAANPNLAPTRFETMPGLIRDGVNGLFPIRAGAFLAASIGLLALVLAVVGLYGVVAFSVTQETRDIGLRLALGADRGRIIGRVLGRSGRLVLAGVVLGGVLAVVVTRQMAGLLIGVRPTDPATYLGVAGLLIVVTTAAAYVPARRAARLDPVKALRADG